MVYPTIKLIVAHANENVIGFKNSIPWHLSEDLKRFKALTENNIVVMGRKTYESLPKKPLPNRENIVLTKNKDTVYPEDVKVIESIPLLLEYLKSVDKSKIVYIIGGESIYKQTLSFCDEILITDLHLEVKGDSYFPDLSTQVWTQKKIERNSSPKFNYDYLTYTRL